MLGDHFERNCGISPSQPAPTQHDCWRGIATSSVRKGVCGETLFFPTRAVAIAPAPAHEFGMRVELQPSSDATALQNDRLSVMFFCNSSCSILERLGNPKFYCFEMTRQDWLCCVDENYIFMDI